MNRRRSLLVGRCALGLTTALVALLLSSCGGGTSTSADSGANKTTLRVDASDADGDTLQYQWRVTAGSIENTNARETVWTLPDGPGLHFAYVTVSDGKGGYTEQQYAVSSDALGTTAPARHAVSYTAPAVTDFSGSTARLRFVTSTNTQFTPPAGGATALRLVYLPDVQVQVTQQASGETVFSGLSDLSGEVSLPKLQGGQSYTVMCATSPDAPLATCGSFTAGTESGVRGISVSLPAARNLRLFGHIAFTDGGVCGTQSEFFGLQSAATVQLLQADGGALTSALRVNRFGDYALDAAVPVKGALKLQVQCESYRKVIDVPASPVAAGYVSTQALELSHQVPNNRPHILKMVANGQDGNVRGRMIVPEATALSNSLPGSRRFLAIKGQDTRLSACMYYRSLGAVKDCDAQGNLIEPISLDDWKRQHQFNPYTGTNTEVAATYINKMDLNLVRRMAATQLGPQHIAFLVCNHPGPVGQTQAEVDAVLDTALADTKLVACVAMEWTSTPGVNNGQAFTKFFTFGPSGRLIPSINLDGRGEKYMPGACVACHGGTQYTGRFPEKGSPSPFLGAGFLPFDTGNYLFGSSAPLSESAQTQAIHDLNQLTRATETSDATALSTLIQGWYADGTHKLDKAYVPSAWRAEDAKTPGAARFYRDVVGSSCRTCHVSLGPLFNWDSTILRPSRAQTHVCGGTADIALNASMPNALTSRDRMADRVKADPALAALMQTFLGCDTPFPDPVYPSR